MSEFTLARVIADDAGRSRFADAPVPLRLTDFSPPAGPLDFAFLEAATSVALIASDDAWRGEAFHPAPARQLMVVLRGRGTITVGTGESRDFGPGGVVQLEDTTGEGHSSRFSGETAVLVVRLDDGGDR